MSDLTVKCSRCRKRMRRDNGWNVITREGVAVEVICPECQTPMENAEAVVNESTIDYSQFRPVVWGL